MELSYGMCVVCMRAAHHSDHEALPVNNTSYFGLLSLILYLLLCTGPLASLEPVWSSGGDAWQQHHNETK